eukprot:g8753.t1
MEGSSFRRPTVAASPRRRSRSPVKRPDPRLEAGADYGSEAASRFEPAPPREPFVPVAYPVAEVAPAEGGGAAIAAAVPYEEEDETSSGSEPEMSEFAHSQFMNSEFDESHLGTEYSVYGNSEFAGDSAAGGSDRLVGTREWSRHQQQSQNSSQFTIERGGGDDDGVPWAGPGREDSGRDYSKQDRRRRRGGGHGSRGPGRAGGFVGEDGRMHDLPPLPEKAKAPSNHSVLSHDLSGFSDFDAVSRPTHHARDYSGSGSGGSGGDITAPHPAPSDRKYWNRGLTGAAAAAAADADARNAARKEQRDRELVEAAAKVDRERAERKAAAGAAAAQKKAAGLAVAGGAYDARGPNGAAVRDVGDSKEVDQSEGGMSEFRASTLEAARTIGDPYDNRPRNRNGTTGEYAVSRHYSIIFTPLMFILCGILMFWEFSLNGWTVEPLAENPMVGPSGETLIEAGAKRTDLIVDNGDWWRLISPMFLHAGVVHFLGNMLGFFQVGAMVERVFGWWRVGSIYLVSGLFGTIVSAVFVPTQVMVGASGAIFGVFGALWADLWQNWSINPDRCQMFTVLTILTVVNVILGLMPFLDNFAHIGGMLMGFFMGLGLLVQKTEDDLGDRLSTRWYQRTLQLVAAVTVPTLLILGLSLLYGRSDPSEWCGWCEKISCVEFPPGSPWWSCDVPTDDCSIHGFTYSTSEQEGTITITCPDTSVETSDSCSDESDATLIACCISLCLE